MKLLKQILLLFLLSIYNHAYSQMIRSEMLFDDEWKFSLGDNKDAGKPSFDDKSWRDIDLPHDWSIESLGGQEPGKIVGPFSRESIGTTATGYTVGGTAWYRQTFTLNSKEKYN